MSEPFEIYGNIAEFRCPFGRLFVHVNVAPKHKDRDRLYALEAAIRDIPMVPEEGEQRVLSYGYNLDVRGVTCDRVRVRFGLLHTLPVHIIDAMFPHQKGGIREDDAFLVEVSFLKPLKRVYL